MVMERSHYKRNFLKLSDRVKPAGLGSGAQIKAPLCQGCTGDRRGVAAEFHSSGAVFGSRGMPGLPPELVQPEGFISVSSILSAVCHAELAGWPEHRWTHVE